MVERAAVSRPPPGLDEPRAQARAVLVAQLSPPCVRCWFREIDKLDRSLTVWLLGMAGTQAEAALPWLERALSDPDAGVAENAASPIRRIKWCLKHGDPPPGPRDEY